MGREIYNIINDMAEVLNASQMQRLQEEQYAFRFVGKEVMIFPLQIVVYKYIIKYKIITRLEVFICHKQCRD